MTKNDSCTERALQIMDEGIVYDAVELAARLNLTRQHVSNVLLGLERGGCVELVSPHKFKTRRGYVTKQRPLQF